MKDETRRSPVVIGSRGFKSFPSRFVPPAGPDGRVAARGGRLIELGADSRSKLTLRLFFTPTPSVSIPLQIFSSRFSDDRSVDANLVLSKSKKEPHPRGDAAQCPSGLEQLVDR